MKADSGKLSVEIYVDLNHNKLQSKVLDYMINNLPASDKNGHHVKLQCKVHPMMADILSGQREVTPSRFWKTQSDQLRSLIGIGLIVSQAYLKYSEQIPELTKLFKFLDLLNEMEKKNRAASLAIEARQMIYEKNINPIFNMDEAIDQLESATAKG